MNSVVEKLMGLDTLSDQVIATDLLLAAKTGIQNYTVALTECASLEVKMTLRRQLAYEIEMHGILTDYMISRGWYHPYHVSEQLVVDNQMTETTLNLPSAL